MAGQPRGGSRASGGPPASSSRSSVPAAAGAAAAGDRTLATSTYVVLGMVRLGARSGYEIKRTVEHSIRYFWTVSQVQIYPALAELELAGLVVGRTDPRGRRPRRLYTITPAGESALRRWLGDTDPLPFELRDIGMVKLFFADAMDSGDARGLLRQVRERSWDRIAALERIRPEADRAHAEGNAYPLLTLHLGLAFHQAMVDVCADFEQRLG